jgi:hypothetical protein
MAVLSGNINKERMEIRSAGNIFSAPTFQGKGYGGTIASPTATQNDQILLNLGGSGHDGSNIVIGNRATILLRASENWNLTSQGTYMGFEITGNGSTLRTEKVRIASNGNVGLGTTTPTQVLDVNSDGIRIRNSRTPVNSNDTCNQGDMAWDSNFVYVCVSSNLWKRAGLGTW